MQIIQQPCKLRNVYSHAAMKVSRRGLSAGLLNRFEFVWSTLPMVNVSASKMATYSPQRASIPHFIPKQQMYIIVDHRGKMCDHFTWLAGYELLFLILLFIGNIRL